jgi:hypothetical protein
MLYTQYYTSRSEKKLMTYKKSMISVIIALLLIGSLVTITLSPFQKASAAVLVHPPLTNTKLPPTSDQGTSNPSDKKGALGLPANTNPNRGQQPPQGEGEEHKQSQGKAKGKNKHNVEQDFVPMATSGNNVYLVWPSNKTGDFEILFRASSDGGKTFGPKINLSNSTGVNSVDQEIAATANSVYITWWDVLQNGTRTPMFIASNDNGKTFGQKVMINSDIAAAAGSSSP